MRAWIDSGRAVSVIESVSAKRFVDDYKKESMQALDVRRDDELNGHLEGALHFPLDTINEHMSSVRSDQTYYIYCAGGYRSLVAASILKARGFDRLVNIEGGFEAIRGQGLSCRLDR